MESVCLWGVQIQKKIVNPETKSSNAMFWNFYSSNTIFLKGMKNSSHLLVQLKSCILAKQSKPNLKVGVTICLLGSCQEEESAQLIEE